MGAAKLEACSQCGAALTPDAPRGLCGPCLLLLALAPKEDAQRIDELIAEAPSSPLPDAPASLARPARRRPKSLTSELPKRLKGNSPTRRCSRLLSNSSAHPL